MPELLFAAHLGTTLYMVGVIWFVQLVHYPLLELVGRAEAAAYEQAHTRRTGWAVGPPMLVELATGVALFWFPPPGSAIWQLWAGAGLLAVLWLSTQLVQVPCHRRLCRVFDPAVHRRLVVSNWVRTVAWSLRGGLVLWMGQGGC